MENGPEISLFVSLNEIFSPSWLGAEGKCHEKNLSYTVLVFGGWSKAKVTILHHYWLEWQIAGWDIVGQLSGFKSTVVGNKKFSLIWFTQFKGTSSFAQNGEGHAVHLQSSQMSLS